MLHDGKLYTAVTAEEKLAVYPTAIHVTWTALARTVAAHCFLKFNFKHSFYLKTIKGCTNISFELTRLLNKLFNNLGTKGVLFNF